MRKALVVTAVTAVGLVGALQGTAHAGDTTTTFVLTAGGIGISVPSSATMSSAAAGAATDTGSLGNVTVTDARGSLVSTWTATVSSTNFTNSTTGGSTADETVAKANVGYASGVGTAALGQVGAMTPTGAVTPVALGSAATGASWTGVGNNTVTWNPTLTFTLLPSQVAGTYTGTITHSVS